MVDIKKYHLKFEDLRGKAQLQEGFAMMNQPE